MTIEEIVRRVVRGHLVVIVLCLLLPVVAVLAVRMDSPADWQATVRLQVTAKAPTSATEADGISSTVLALATTPGILQRAVDEAGASVDVHEMAGDGVTAQRLGQSPIVELTVVHPDREVAAAVVTQLGREVAAFMNQGGTRGRLDAALTTVDERIAEVRDERERLLAELEEASTPVGRDDLRVDVQLLDQELSRLSSDRLQLVLAEAGGGGVLVIGETGPDLTKAPSGLVPLVALAALLGLALGLTVAASIEALRPQITGPRSLATLLGVPLFGQRGAKTTTLAPALGLAARRLGVDVVVLVGADEQDENRVPRLLEQLQGPRPSSVGQEAPESVRLGRRGERGASARSRTAESDPLDSFNDVRFTGLDDISRSDEMTAGIVVVSSGRLLQRRFDLLDDVIKSARWPVVGVLDVSGRHRGGLS